jgi:hypothetical protein
MEVSVDTDQRPGPAVLAHVPPATAAAVLPSAPEVRDKILRLFSPSSRSLVMRHSR